MIKMKKIIIILSLAILVISCKNINDTKDNKQNVRMKFNSESWKKGDFKLRGKMSNDLVDSEILIGKTKDEVIELLGKFDGELSDMIFYKIDVGIIFGSGKWLYMLMIYFDESNNLVSEVVIGD